MLMTSLQIVQKIIQSWEMDDYLDFQITTQPVYIDEYFSDNNVHVMQECLVIIAKHKQITVLPADCHADYTVETYQTDCVNAIDLLPFSIVVFESFFGIQIFDGYKNSIFECSTDLLKILE